MIETFQDGSPFLSFPPRLKAEKAGEGGEEATQEGIQQTRLGGTCSCFLSAVFISIRRRERESYILFPFSSIFLEFYVMTSTLERNPCLVEQEILRNPFHRFLEELPRNELETGVRERHSGGDLATDATHTGVCKQTRRRAHTHMHTHTHAQTHRGGGVC